MTGIRASATVSALAACLGFGSAFMMQSVLAQDAALRSQVQAATIHFDLPRQPLAEALQAYGQVTELFVMVDAAPLPSWVSAPVNGFYVAAEALQRLLAGTGLDVRFTSANSAVILPPGIVPQLAASAAVPEPGPAAAPIAASTIDGVGTRTSYALMVQARLTEALCRSPQTRP